MARFQAAVDYNVGTNPVSVAVGDFNGDGKPDLAVGGSSVSVLLGNGDGTFQPAVNYGPGSGWGLAVADFNGDGKLDLATPLSVLLGNGDGTFQPAGNYGSRGNSVAVGDFNRDGKPDLAVPDKGSTNVSVLLGTAMELSKLRQLRFARISKFHRRGRFQHGWQLDLVVAMSSRWPNN